MLTFGDRLRTEREKRGVGLDEIEAATRIRRNLLEALESNEFGELPGPVFARGYVRAYADFLGTDPEPLLRAYNRELRVRELPKEVAGNADLLVELRRVLHVRRSPGRFGISRRALVTLAVGAGLVLGALGVTWGVRRTLGDRRPVVAAPERAPSPAAMPVEPEPRVPEAPLDTPPLEEPTAELLPELRVEEFGVGSRIVDRVLVGRDERFEEDGEVWFWTLVVGGSGDDEIGHVWIHDGRDVESIALPIGGPYWRTYSRHYLPRGALGSWAVEARNASGSVLARAEFLCTARAER